MRKELPSNSYQFYERSLLSNDSFERELRERFLQAGFSLTEMPALGPLIEYDRGTCQLLTADVIGLLGKLYSSPKSRILLRQGLWDIPSLQVSRYLLALAALKQKSRDDEQAENGYIDLLQQISLPLAEDPDVKNASDWYLTANYLALLIYTNDLFKSFFGQTSSQDLVEKLLKVPNANTFRAIESLVTKFAQFAGDKTHLHQMMNLDFLSDFNNRRLLDFVLSRPEYSGMVIEYLSSPKTWTNRVRVADKCFRQAQLGGVGEAEVNYALASLYLRQRIGDRNSPAFQAEASRINQSSRSEKFTFLSQLRQSISVADTIRLKQSIIRASSAGSETPSHSKWLQERLQQITVRESRLHPLVSLGIAPTIGYEIEFNRKTIPDELGGQTLQEVLNYVGIKRGEGGGSADETSPGPFYDPETALTIFKLYSEAGVLDFYRYTGMTCHLNIDLPSKEGLAFLIQSLYFSGAAYSPEFSRSLDHPRAKDRKNIHHNHDESGKHYFESKAFDVMTAPGFVWNFRSFAYLGWALRAYQEAEIYCHRDNVGYQRIVSSGMNDFKKELAITWLDYRRLFYSAIKPLGFSALMQIENYAQLTRRFDKQISLVFPNLASRYDDPRREIKGAVPVKLGQREWPNIVAFSIDLIDETVAKIKAIEAKVEEKTIAAIRLIEASPVAQRTDLIAQFIADFNYLPFFTSPVSKLATYEKVKDLFADRL